MQSFKIERLPVVQGNLLEARREKAGDHVHRSPATAFHLGIVGSKPHQKVFILPLEWGWIQTAIIPEKHNPTTRTENSPEFCFGSRPIEPVECLCCRDEVYRTGGETGVFGRAFNAVILA